MFLTCSLKFLVRHMWTFQIDIRQSWRSICVKKKLSLGNSFSSSPHNSSQCWNQTVRLISVNPGSKNGLLGTYETVKYYNKLQREFIELNGEQLKTIRLWLSACVWFFCLIFTLFLVSVVLPLPAVHVFFHIIRIIS